MKVWLADWDPTIGMLLLANLSKHNITFYNNKFECKITKGNIRLIPRMHNMLQLFGQLLSNIWFIWQGRADTGQSLSWAQYGFSFAK